MKSVECCGQRHAVNEGQWIECPKCGASITHTTLKAKTDTVAKSPACNDVLSAVQSAVNHQLCDARDHYDGMQRSVDRHKSNNCDKNSLMNTYQDAMKALNEAHADVERWMKAQAFVRDKLPKLIEGR